MKKFLSKIIKFIKFLDDTDEAQNIEEEILEKEDKINVKISKKIILKGVLFYIDKIKHAEVIEGDKAWLEREPNNRWDNNAIAVYANDCILGHISKELAVFLAPLIDDCSIKVSAELELVDIIKSIIIIKLEIEFYNELDFTKEIKNIIASEDEVAVSKIRKVKIEIKNILKKEELENRKEINKLNDDCFNAGIEYMKNEKFTEAMANFENITIDYNKYFEVQKYIDICENKHEEKKVKQEEILYNEGKKCFSKKNWIGAAKSFNQISKKSKFYQKTLFDKAEKEKVELEKYMDAYENLLEREMKLKANQQDVRIKDEAYENIENQLKNIELSKKKLFKKR